MANRNGSIRRWEFLVVCAIFLAPSASAETVTLPVAASVVGAAPFFSDVRVFNTSYAGPVTVTATYRCAPGSSAACATQPVKVFDLGPREARAFDDISVSLFGVPNSLGAVEFDTASGGIVVTSRLFSPASSPPWPAGTVGSVGMFIPGLPSSAAKPVTVLTNLSNAGSATGSFRTNVGVYNPNGGTVTATVRLYESGSVLLGQTSVTLSGKTGTQISNIYGVVGFGSLSTTNGYATVESDGGQALFTYAATADNVTQDPVLVVGVEDLPAPPGFHPPSPTATDTPSGPTATPTPPPTATPTPGPAKTIVNLTAKQFQWDFDGGTSSSACNRNGNCQFTMKVGQTYEVHIKDIDPRGNEGHQFSGVPTLGISGLDILVPSGPEQVFTFTPTTSQVGPAHLFSCNNSACGIGHDSMLANIAIVP
jgi:hypothetical protein